MIDKLSELLSAIHRVPTTLLIVVASTAAAILFMPSEVAATLAVDEFRTTYRVFLGPGLLLVCAWLLARAISALALPLKQRRNQRRLEQGLQTLTPDERGYLAEFLEGRTTIHVPVEDGIVGSLVARRILYRSSNVFDVLQGVPYNMQPWAREYITRNPQVLSGAVRREARRENW